MILEKRFITKKKGVWEKRVAFLGEIRLKYVKAYLNQFTKS